MSTFVKAMDDKANRVTIPEKPGTMVRATVGHDQHAALLELWVMLKRGTESSDISKRIQKIVRSCSASPNKGEVLTLLCRLIVQKRDCHNGGGEKDCVFSALIALRESLPLTAAALVRFCLPTYGYAKDLVLMAQRCKEADDMELLAECVKGIADGVKSKDMLACKWAPREGKSGAWLAKMCRHELKLSAKEYRKLLSGVMKENAVSIPEVLMSAKRFREIEPSRVPSRCLKVHRRAFLDEDKKGGRRHVEDKDKDLADREICRQKFAETMKAAVEGKGPGLKGARIFPHELVADVRKKGGVPSDLQRQTMCAMWAAIVKDVKKQIAEQKAKDADAASSKFSSPRGGDVSFDPSLMVPMSDVSGSMTGVPMDCSIALGLLLAEVGHPAFRGRVLTFDSAPEWVVFDHTDDFVDRVQKLASSPWGGSTNFEAAMGLIAQVVREQHLSESEVPGITCFSDMKFDKADRTFQTCVASKLFVGSKIRAKFYLKGKLLGAYPGTVERVHVDGTFDVTYDDGDKRSHVPLKEITLRGFSGGTLDTHYERIQEIFSQVGMEISGVPYRAPRLCFWDLAHSGGGSQPGFPVTSDDKGVQLISGFSPALLKLVMTGERMDTPYDTFLKAVSDDRYDEVEQVALRAMEIDPSFC